MGIIQFILISSGVFSYIIVGTCAVWGFQLLTRQRECLAAIADVLHKVHMLQSATHLQSAFTHIEQMKTDMVRLAERDEFEAARKLQQFIKDQEQATLKELDAFKERFGDCAEVNFEKIELRNFKDK